MQNFEEKHLQKNNAAYSDELRKENIKPADLLQEIEPLLREYFIGTFELTDDTIKMSFENGQKFRLVIGGVC
ncbi:MAG: hypothetical protein K2O54_01395 [Prevotella sp.]|nr:hypothetical protein [Prevotella sp.]